MTAIGELDAASTKAGAEPATPAEGAVTKGAVGVGKRQTFKYLGKGGPATLILKHDLGTTFVAVVAYKIDSAAEEPEQQTGSFTNLVAKNATELQLKIEASKTETWTFVLTA